MKICKHFTRRVHYHPCFETASRPPLSLISYFQSNPLDLVDSSNLNINLNLNLNLNHRPYSSRQKSEFRKQLKPSEMDRQSVYSLSVLPPDYDNNEDTRGQIQSQLEQFILQFRLDNSFIYRSVASEPARK